MKKYLLLPLIYICLFAAFGINKAKAQVKLGSRNNTINLDYETPKTYEIGGITVSGVRFLDPDALIAITGLKVGDKISVPGEQITSAIRKLWEQDILGDVQVNVGRIEGDFIFLDFFLKERPRLSKFTFKGTRKGETNDLREKISLIRGRVVTDALIKNAQNTIRKFFVEKGYMYAKVSIVQVPDTVGSTNTVSLRIEVDKKKKVKIASLTFNDNLAFEDEKLRRKLKETKEKRPWRLFKASKFVRSKFDKDQEKLIEFYNGKGYRDAAVLSDSVYPALDKTGKPQPALINVEINMEEGPKYYFRNISWTGNYIYDTKILSSILGIKKGDVYDRSNLEKRLNYNPAGLDVSSLYMDDGYLFFSIDPVEIAIIGDSIDVEMRVYEGAQATINKINIAGNTKTNDHVILREIRTLPGEKFSRSNLIRTQRELSQLGYFDPEQIGIQPMPNPATGMVDINYNLVEKPSDQIELSGGWGGLFGFVGTLGLSFNNFSARKILQPNQWRPLPGGDGQRLAIRAQANGRFFQTYSLSFTEPWLGGRRPNSFTASINHSRQMTSNQDVPGGLGKLRISGATLSLGRRLRWPDDYFTLMNTLSFNQYQLIDYPVNTNFSLGFSNGRANSFNFITVLSRNSINNPTFPSAGSSISLSVNLTPPYSAFRSDNKFATLAEQYKWIEYNKWMFDASWFISLAKNLVVNSRAHMGFLGSYSKELGVGPFERFTVGGAGLSGFNFLLATDVIGLRGYDDNSILNRPDRTRVVNGFAQPAELRNGIIFNKYVSELRYAVSTNPAATIFVLGFVEAGNNWKTYKEYNPFNLYRSAGLGARIFMPAFGLLGLDYGWRFDDVPGQTNMRASQFHFTIGQQIR